MIILVLGCTVVRQTPLSESDEVTEVQALIAEGLDPNLPSATKTTRLHRAAKLGHLQVVRALLEAGADPNAAELEGFTPLHMAAREGQLAVAEELLKAGADPRVVTRHGLTPADLASYKGHGDVARLLKGVGTLAQPRKTVQTFSTTSRGVAVYPFAAKGGANASLAEGLTAIFTSTLAGSPCVRIVGEDIIRDLAKQQGLEQACGTESCQIDLASQARADVLIRGDLVQLGGTYVLTTMAVDLATKKTLLSENVRSSESELLDRAETLGAKVGRGFSCSQGGGK